MWLILNFGGMLSSCWRLAVSCDKHCGQTCASLILCACVCSRDVLQESEFSWSKELQGYILSSYFYGYVSVQVVAGWAASRWGGKHVYGCGMMLAMAATLLTPLAARTHVHLLITARVLVGLGTVRHRQYTSQSIIILHPYTFVIHFCHTFPIYTPNLRL